MAQIVVIYGLNFSFKMQFLRVSRRQKRRFFRKGSFFRVLYLIVSQSALNLRKLPCSLYIVGQKNRGWSQYEDCFSRLVSTAAVFKGNFEMNKFLQDEMPLNSFLKIMKKFNSISEVAAKELVELNIKKQRYILFLLITKPLI